MLIKKKTFMLLAQLLLSVFVSLLIAIDVFASQLNPITISYTIDLKSNKLGNARLGKIQTTLTKTKTSYTVHSITKAQGIAAILMGSNFQLSCDFEIKDGRAISKNYTGGRKNKNDYQATFDWENRKVSFTDGESLDMPQGYMVDDCNMPFAAALLKGEGLSDETLYVLDGKKKRLRAYTLKSTSKEELDTPLGIKTTIKVVLEREFKPEKTFTLWLAPEYDYVPIKMEEKRKSRTTIFMVNKIDT